METKDYNLTCGEVIENLLTLADAYEKASAGKAPNGFAFNPADAAANMKAAVHFIGRFGQQLPRWIPVSERLPEEGVKVLVCDNGKDGPYIDVGAMDRQEWFIDGDLFFRVTHWMPLPAPPTR